MKTVLLAAFFFCSTNIFAQTTQEEYNYVTKGYIQTVNAGLDVKQGYYTQKLSGTGNYIAPLSPQTKFEVFGLYKKDGSKLAAFMYLLYLNEKLTKVLCYPLPGSDQNLYNAFYADMQLLTSFQKNVLVEAISWGFINAKK